MPPIVAVAVPSILSAAAVATVAVRRSRRPIAPRRGGFNCCEACGRELSRHPQQTWRYDGTCARCGHIQVWAAPAPAQPPVPAPVQQPSPTPAPARVAEEPIAGIAAAAAEI